MHDPIASTRIVRQTLTSVASPEAPPMARIRWINESEATGPIADAYARWFAKNPGRTEIPGILKSMSLRPDLLTAFDALSDDLHFRDGFLTRRIKEMIGTYVSALNRCQY